MSSAIALAICAVAAIALRATDVFTDQTAAAFVGAAAVALLLDRALRN